MCGGFGGHDLNRWGMCYKFNIYLINALKACCTSVYFCNPWTSVDNKNSSMKLKQLQVILGAVTEMIMNILAVHTRDLLRFNHSINASW